jgi:hypothetical protein
LKDFGRGIAHLPKTVLVIAGARRRWAQSLR